MQEVSVDHILHHLYGALKTSKVQWSQLDGSIRKLQAISSTESDKKRIAELKNQEVQARMVIIVISHCFVEALANHYIASKCDARRFNSLERHGILKKWTTTPCEFVKEYRFPEKGDALYDDLDRLARLRNCLGHSKSRIHINDQLIHEGDLPLLSDTSSLTPEKCLSLPVRLVEHLCLYDYGAAFELCIYSDFSDADRNEIISKVRAKSAKQRTIK